MMKSKLLHIALFMCIFSFAMNAQVYLAGDQASSALLSEASSIRSQITTAMTNGSFSSDEDYIQADPTASAKFILLNALTDLPIKSGDTTTQVEETFTNFIEAIENSGYSNLEVDELRQNLLSIIAQ